MENAVKMYLVPQQQLDKLNTSAGGKQNVRQTVENDLDETMRQILNRPDLIPYEKAKLYASALQRFLNIVKQGDEETTQLTLSLPVEDKTTSETNTASHKPEDVIVKEVIGNIPARNRKNASFIMDKLSKSSDVASWNDKGEFIFKGVTIRGSHIMDLIKNLTAPQKISNERRPLGWFEMLKTVAGLNIPFSTIPNVGVRREISDIKKADPLYSPRSASKRDDSDSDTEPVFKSPRFTSSPWLSF